MELRLVDVDVLDRRHHPLSRAGAAPLLGGAVLAGVVVCVLCGHVVDSPVAVEAGGLPHGDTTWGRLFLVALVASFVAYVLALRLLRHAYSLRVVLAVACAIQLAPLGGPLLLSTDAWTYWAYAKVENPYRDTPAEAGEAGVYAGADWVDQTSVYGPAFSLAAEPTAAVDSPDGAAFLFRLGAAAAVLAAALFAARRSRTPALAAAFVAWNPILAVHFAGGGHNDALMAALTAAALALGDSGRSRGAGVSWALAALVKWVPLVLLPLRALEARATGRRVSHGAFAVTAAAVLVLATALYGLAWLDVLSPLVGNATRETSYAIPHRLGLPGWALLVPYAIAYAWLLREAARGRARCGLAAGLLLLALPYLAVWYVVWAVAVAAGDDDRLARLVALGVCAYLLPQTIPT